MNKWGLAALVWLVALVQAYFLSGLFAGHGSVNLLLLLILIITLKRSLKLAIAMALWGGFWLDGIAGTHFGMHMAVFCLFVLSLGGLQRLGLEFDRMFNKFLVVSLAFVLYNGYWLVLLWLRVDRLVLNPELIGWWSVSLLVTLSCLRLFGRRVEGLVSSRTSLARY